MTLGAEARQATGLASSDPSRATVDIFTSPQCTLSATAVARAVAFLGLAADTTVVSAGAGLAARLHCAARSESRAVVISADLLRADEGHLDISTWRRALPSGVRNCLIVDVDTPATHARAGVRARSAPEVDRLVPQRYAITDTARDVMGPLGGVSGLCPDAREIPTFRPDWRACEMPLDVLVAFDGRPVFMRHRSPQHNIYLWVTDQVVDVGMQLAQDEQLDGCYLALLPLLSFLLAAFGTACWHAPEPMGRLTIDDPLLQPRYGFLRYDDLFASLARFDYGLSIAFIPSNHRRSSATLTRRLAGLGSRFSLCVHGCDHTNHEYAYLDEADARALSDLALGRMRLHERRYGLGWDPVMIFPQGQFSAASIPALESAGFLAAVNSTCFPHEDGNARLTLAELLAPAVTAFAGIPVFRRRRSDDWLGFGLDLLLGRPAIVCEHHQFFSDGFARLEATVQKLHSMEPNLRWPSMTDIAMRSCRQRKVDSGFEVVVHGKDFAWRNPDDLPLEVRFLYHDSAHQVFDVEADVDGFTWHRVEGGIAIALELPPRGQIRCRLKRRTHVAPRRVGFGLIYRGNAIVRRRLSEFRDNWISQRPALLSLTQQVARALRATGDSSTE